MPRVSVRKVRVNEKAEDQHVAMRYRGTRQAFM